MDPALHELLEGDQSEEIEAIIKLKDPSAIPTHVRIVARFGDIATCRLKRRCIREVRENKNVISLKAPRLLQLDSPIVDIAEAEDIGLRKSDERRSSVLAPTGRGVVIGFIDWGLDFVHPNFRNEDGSTRLLALWDQANITTTAANPYGYGVIYTRDDINQALRSSEPYMALGYHPAIGDPLGSGAHGTHTCDIAAGNGRAQGSPMGIAPEADIIFVHLAARGLGGLANLGDSSRILEALNFIFRQAQDKPAVVNISMGRHGGPHDGESLVEEAMDALLVESHGCAIVQSVGNYYASRAHASGQLQLGRERTLKLWTDKADITPNELEIWYSGLDRFVVKLRPPEGDTVIEATLGQDLSIKIDGIEVGRIYHRERDPNNGDNHIDIFLQPNAPAGHWLVTLIGEDIVDGRFHAWVERDASCHNCQSRFDPDDCDPTGTTGTICNGFRTIAVGAFNPHMPGFQMAPFSSSGPTRSGRSKPDLIAPGVSILAARSTPRNYGAGSPLLTRMSGTSMAAPHVTGTVALMFQSAGRKLSIEETRRLLLGSTKTLPLTGPDLLRIGSGCLDTVQAISGVENQAGMGKNAVSSLIQDVVVTPEEADHQESLAEMLPNYDETLNTFSMEEVFEEADIDEDLILSESDDIELDEVHPEPYEENDEGEDIYEYAYQDEDEEYLNDD